MRTNIVSDDKFPPAESNWHSRLPTTTVSSGVEVLRCAKGTTHVKTPI